MVVPMGSSHRPGFFTMPLTPKSFVPASDPGLSALYHSGPSRRMCGTLQSVSTLFTTVGRPQRPLTWGNGGLLRGVGLRPSSAFRRPLSSPHM